MAKPEIEQHPLEPFLPRQCTIADAGELSRRRKNGGQWTLLSQLEQ